MFDVEFDDVVFVIVVDVFSRWFIRWGCERFGSGRIVCEDDAETDCECAAAPLTNNPHYLNAFLPCKQPFNNIIHYPPLPAK